VCALRTLPLTHSALARSAFSAGVIRGNDGYAFACFCFLGMRRAVRALANCAASRRDARLHSPAARYTAQGGVIITQAWASAARIWRTARVEGIRRRWKVS